MAGQKGAAMHSPPNEDGSMAFPFWKKASPDNSWHSELDLSATTSQPYTAIDNGDSEAGPTQGLGSLLSAWDASWFGCSSLTVERPEAPACYLTTYGSLYGPLRLPVYLSGAGDEPDTALTQHLTTLDFQQGTYWGPNNKRNSLDLSSLAAALAGTGAGGSQQWDESQGSNNHQEQRLSPSTVSPEYGSASTTGVRSQHNSSVPCDATGTSSGEAGGLPRSSVTAAQSHSNQILLLPPPSTADTDTLVESSAIHLPARPGTDEALQPAVLGTWVHRQYHLNQQGTSQSRSQPDCQHSHHIASTVAGATGSQMRSVQSQEQLKEAQQEQQPKHPTAAPAMNAAMEAAWRWRFARRWHAEQQRCPEDDPGSVDKHDQALQYLHAGGGTGWNMQVSVARTQSTDGSALHSMGTQGAGSLLAGEMLLDDGSYQAVGSLARTIHRGGAAESATREVNSLNRRAMRLLEQQTQLERAAEERWNTSVTSNGDTWVGHHMNTVEIDDWGTFKFLVVRVRGRDNRQRILIRGRNYCSEGQITEDINRKMVQLASQKGCVPEAIEVMGGGVMEWRRERDRHLHLHSGFSFAAPVGAGVPKPASSQELLNLAAVLAKQHLPVHFKVSIQGQ